MTSLHALSLSHFSDKAVLEMRDAGKDEPCGLHKPAGLWVSVDGEDDWPAWCRAEDFCLDKLAIQHRVMLASDANILHITAAAEVFSLSESYPSTKLTFQRQSEPDWISIAAQYDGIIIAPYQWKCRLHERTSWYYSWDCASGVIWKSRAIASIKVIDVKREAA